MFKIDRMQNRLTPLEERRFTELGLRERSHLQEWLANLPTALGEDLLIIQKEFDGFEDTRERLDLLALDREGRLVVIENKLDDTGRDLVWQSVKYAAYVSTLDRSQIVEIYQRYLDRCCGGGDASEKICEFLDVDALDEVVLNAGDSQRIVMIAAQFRKEVTATALWLRTHGVRAQCFKVTPYALADEVFLSVRQIIPVPEAEAYMISMSSKGVEEKAAQTAQSSRTDIRSAFWRQALEALRAAGVTIYQNIGPSRDSWLCARSGLPSCPYALIFGKREARVELWIARPSADENRLIFERLLARKVEIESVFGAKLDWKPLEARKSCRIEYACSFDGYNQDHWPEITKWMIDHIRRLESAFKEPLRQEDAALRAQGRAG